MSETSQTVVTAIAEYIAQLEAEIEDLKGANLPLYSDRIRNLETRIAELEAERDRLKGYLCEWCAQGAPKDELVSDKHRIPNPNGHGWIYPTCGLYKRGDLNRLRAENAILWKALEEIAISILPTSYSYLRDIARAALARIPEAKPQQ